MSTAVPAYVAAGCSRSPGDVAARAALAGVLAAARRTLNRARSAATTARRAMLSRPSEDSSVC